MQEQEWYKSNINTIIAKWQTDNKTDNKTDNSDINRQTK